ncbi:MAG TPA: hypothetical protein VHT27_07340 [Solirubrobacteraceae bacterium]|jgi:hypothetical protein|nr:hypothetical protein [Solirubrobacteraceae bacterium]
MYGDRSGYGLLIAALGAAVLAVSVFLPWYGVHITAEGAAAAGRLSEQVVSQFGNARLQQDVAPLHAGLNSLVGHEVASISGHDAFKYMSVILLLLAGLALLDALFGLAGVRGGLHPEGAGAALVLVGLVASGYVAFRMVARPGTFEGVFSLSLRAGAWSALIGALMILAGGLWPRGRVATGIVEERVESALSGLSGWTPQS